MIKTSIRIIIFQKLPFVSGFPDWPLEVVKKKRLVEVIKSFLFLRNLSKLEKLIF